MTRQQGGKEKKDDKSSLHKSVEVLQRKSLFGKYSEAEMLALLKGLAMDPCQPQFSLEKTQPLQNEILRLRKVMVLNETEIPPWDLLQDMPTLLLPISLPNSHFP